MLETTVVMKRRSETVKSIRRPPCGRASGFTMIETMMSVAISVIAVTSFFGAAGQALRVVRTGKETAYASQLLQQRIEGGHAALRFEQVVDNALLLRPRKSFLALQQRWQFLQQSHNAPRFHCSLGRFGNRERRGQHAA